MRFERDAAGAWFRHDSAAGEASGHVHRIDPADAERIQQVLQTFSRARIERTLRLDADHLAGYGLVQLTPAPTPRLRRVVQRVVYRLR